jgi:nucleoid-associated protein YgaU
MNPDAAIVTAATWVAIAAAGYAAIAACASLAATTRSAFRTAVVAAVVLTFTCAGIAAASTVRPRGHRPAVSVDWPLAVHGRRPATVVVESGDCLWNIAARRLARPTAARIAVAWPRWWRANRARVGADPDLIRPGQRLRPPVFRSPS